MAGAGDPSTFTHGADLYGPPVDKARDLERQWYTPAHTLAPRSVQLQPGVPRLLSGEDSRRKFVAVRNLSTDVIFVGGSGSITVTPGPTAGFPVNPGEGFSFDAHEFDGDLWAVTAMTASATVDVRVMDPEAGG